MVPEPYRVVREYPSGRKTKIRSYSTWEAAAAAYAVYEVSTETFGGLVYLAELISDGTWEVRAIAGFGTTNVTPCLLSRSSVVRFCLNNHPN